MHCAHLLMSYVGRTAQFTYIFLCKLSIEVHQITLGRPRVRLGPLIDLTRLTVGTERGIRPNQREPLSGARPMKSEPFTIRWRLVELGVEMDRPTSSDRSLPSAAAAAAAQ